MFTIKWLLFCHPIVINEKSDMLHSSWQTLNEFQDATSNFLHILEKPKLNDSQLNGLIFR